MKIPIELMWSKMVGCLVKQKQMKLVNIPITPARDLAQTQDSGQQATQDLQEAQDLVQVQDPGRGHEAVQDPAAQLQDPGQQAAEVAEEPPAVTPQYQHFTKDLTDCDDDPLKTWFPLLMSIVLLMMVGQGSQVVMRASMMGICPTGGQANNILR